jgi:hypothetical protein
MRPEALRPATRKAAARHRHRFRTRLASGEKPYRKRMATLAVVYDAEPAPRRPHDVIAVPGGRSGHRPARAGPKASGKWLCGSVRADPDQVIGDRLDISGARWGLAGAEAILKLRALIANGDFPTYWRYHLDHDHHARYHDDYDLTA